MEQTSPIEKAIHIVGSLTTLAKLVGVSPPTVHEWKTGGRPIPILRCRLINEATSGAVTLQELRPKDYQVIWPELAQVNTPTQYPATTAA